MIKHSRDDDRVVVVGAGLGGLAAAASLRAEGFDVQIVEKNERIGGKLNFHEIEGYGFDGGFSGGSCGYADLPCAVADI